MKHFCKKTIMCLCLVCALLAGLVQSAFAAGMYVSAGQSSVSVGDTVSFTIAVPEGSEAWTYSVSYSGNLTLQSGVLDPMGFQGDSRYNTLIFRANATGTGEVSISAGSYCINGTNYDASGYDSVSIVAASAPSDGYHHEEYNNNSSSDSNSGDKEPSKSTNSALASLSVDKGKLTPAFDPEVTEYKLSLPVKTEKITLTATPSDSTATVSGADEIDVKPGENKISIVVTAENGDSTTYTVNAVVAQMPTVFLTYNDTKLGVVSDVSDITAPAGFTATTVSYQGSDIPAWTNAQKTVTLLYLMDEQFQSTFYAYTAEDGVVGPYLPLEIDGKAYIYTGIPEKQRHIPGLVFGSVEAFDQTLDGFRYEDEALGEFYVLYLMDSEGNYGYFSYDSKTQTLQRFSGAVYSSENTGLTVPWMYVYIAGGVAAAMLLTIIILAVVSAKRKKQIATVSADMAAAEAPVEMGEVPESAAEEEATPSTAVSSEPSAPAEASPEAAVPVEAPAEVKTPPQEPLTEDVDDALSLDELLNDIRNM